MSLLKLIDKLCGVEIMDPMDASLIELCNSVNAAIERVQQLKAENEKNKKLLEELKEETIRFQDETGAIHEIRAYDFEAFNEAMSHKDWCLVF